MSARTDLRGGWRATAIPTATSQRATGSKDAVPVLKTKQLQTRLS